MSKNFAEVKKAFSDINPDRLIDITTGKWRDLAQTIMSHENVLAQDNNH